MTLIFYLKHTLTFEDGVDAEDWVACELVHGGYIPSAFHPTTCTIFKSQSVL